MTDQTNNNVQIDLNNDNKIDDRELKVVETRFKNRRRMAWVSLFSMILLTAFLLTPLISIERIQTLNGIMGSFYFAMASVIGAYMGFTTWATKT